MGAALIRCFVSSLHLLVLSFLDATLFHLVWHMKRAKGVVFTGYQTIGEYHAVSGAYSIVGRA